MEGGNLDRRDAEPWSRFLATDETRRAANDPEGAL